MRDYLVTWKTKRRDRKRVLEWVFGEWDAYADKKNDSHLEQVEQSLRSGGIKDGSWWYTVVTNYLWRAQSFGLDTPKGKQQMMKAVATMIDLGACVVRVYGDPPEPGEPS